MFLLQIGGIAQPFMLMCKEVLWVIASFTKIVFWKKVRNSRKTKFRMFKSIFGISLHHFVFRACITKLKTKNAWWVLFITIHSLLGLGILNMKSMRESQVPRNMFRSIRFLKSDFKETDPNACRILLFEKVMTLLLHWTISNLFIRHFGTDLVTCEVFELPLQNLEF